MARPGYQTAAAWLFAALLAAALPAEARAQDSATAQFTLTGTAIPVCNLPAPVTTGAAANATFASNTITLTQFIDPQTALVNQSNLTVQFPNTLCNYNATVTLSSKNGGMVAGNGSVIAGGSGTFLTKVPYTASASWGSFSLALDTSALSGAAAAVSKQTGGANSGNLLLTFATQASAAPVAQGTYQDVLTIKIGAPM